MSWFNYQILTEEEVKKEALELPSKYQVGSQVDLHLPITGDNSGIVTVRGYVIGVNIKGRHAIHYDLALPIENTHLYVAVRDVRGWVTEIDGECPPDGGLVDMDSVKAELDKQQDNGSDKPHTLTVVQGGKEQ